MNITYDINTCIHTSGAGSPHLEPRSLPPQPNISSLRVLFPLSVPLFSQAVVCICMYVSNLAYKGSCRHVTRIYAYLYRDMQVPSYCVVFWYSRLHLFALRQTHR